MDVAILGVEGVGRQYASACTRAGLVVSLCGSDANAVVDAVESLGASGDSRVDGTTDVPAAVTDADAVIETRPGDPETCRKRLAEIEDHAPDDALLAVTVENRSMTSLGVGLREPDRLVGLHSAAPIGVGDPIEVVVAELTGQEAARAAEAFVAELGWAPLRVRDAPGFVSGRLRLALQAEAIRLYEGGVADPSTIDKAMVTADGHDAGPLELSDRQGLDAVLDALETLAETVGSRYDPPQLLREKVAADQLGRESGEGFYEWENGEPTGPADE
jgi:3-hydroxybutyryl-CoA dehydrogenase